MFSVLKYFSFSSAIKSLAPPFPTTKRGIDHHINTIMKTSALLAFVLAACSVNAHTIFQVSNTLDDPGVHDGWKVSFVLTRISM